VKIAFVTDAGNLVRQPESERDLCGARKQGADPYVFNEKLNDSAFATALDNAVIARSFDSEKIGDYARGAGGGAYSYSQPAQFYSEPLSDSLAELCRARALIGKPLAIDFADRGGRTFDTFFFDLCSERLGNQQPDRHRDE
jgi:hypothetical protein